MRRERRFGLRDLELRSLFIINTNLANANAVVSLTQSRGVVFSNNQNMNDAYQAFSFGELGINPDSDGDGNLHDGTTVTIGSSGATACNDGTWRSQAESAVAGQGISLSSATYRHLFFVMPSSGNACS